MQYNMNSRVWRFRPLTGNLLCFRAGLPDRRNAIAASQRPWPMVLIAATNDPLPAGV